MSDAEAGRGGAVAAPLARRPGWRHASLRAGAVLVTIVVGLAIAKLASLRANKAS